MAADPREAAVVFTDDANTPIHDRFGRPMMRPTGLDPHLFVNQGALDKRTYEALLRYSYGEDPGGVGLYMLEHTLAELSRFRQGGDWDAQRIGNHFHAEFVDYATVAIGLYAASSGMKRSEILAIQDDYARLRSHYPSVTVMDRTYTHLPARNVANTETGYQLFETGRIQPVAERR